MEKLGFRFSRFLSRIYSCKTNDLPFTNDKLITCKKSQGLCVLCLLAGICVCMCMLDRVCMCVSSINWHIYLPFSKSVMMSDVSVAMVI